MKLTSTPRILFLAHAAATALLWIPTGESWNNLRPTRATKAKTATKQPKVKTIEMQPTRPKKEFVPPPPPSTNQWPSMPEMPNLMDNMPDMEVPNPITPNLWNSATSSMLGFAARLAPKQVQQHSERSAHLTVNSLPPNSIEIDLRDVPIVGKALSGTYAKIQKPLKTKPSIQVSSPRDKLGAIQEAADKGKLQFGLEGLFQSVVDIQVQPNQPGVAPVEIKSPLIPKLPFGNRPSDWNKVSNLGDGKVYYFNTKTGESQFEKPIAY